jgi:hypothetical protein
MSETESERYWRRQSGARPVPDVQDSYGGVETSLAREFRADREHDQRARPSICASPDAAIA